MPTIKDIAIKAGVSQGTVSNVLNSNGNVSSKKIRQVMEAASALGYTANEKAKILRTGNSKTLAVILPNLYFKPYVDFYMSFKTHAQNMGYHVVQYISNDDIRTEESLLREIRAGLAAGVAVFTAMDNASAYYSAHGFLPHEVIFVGRRAGEAGAYIGFDYEACGRDMADYAVKSDFADISVLTDSLRFSSESEFLRGFTAKMQAAHRPFTHMEGDARRKGQIALALFASGAPDAILLSEYGYAEAVKDTRENFYHGATTQICTAAPLFTMPENDFVKYELNYRMLGKEAAQTLLGQLSSQSVTAARTLSNYGFRTWFEPQHIPPKTSGSINVLALDSPEALIMQHFARLYTEKTGIQIHVAVYKYDELYEIACGAASACIYDVIRLDVMWMPWLAEQILRPLDAIDAEIQTLAPLYLDGVWQTYACAGKHVYALPSTPSMALLFYRTDLFENTEQKRLFQERYKRPLTVPTSFEEFNLVAEFFTKSVSAHSPVQYGATLTLGSTGVACSEFLARYYARGGKLFAADGTLALTNETACEALQEVLCLRRFTNPVHGNWWTDTASSFAQGASAMTILYSNYASTMLGRDSAVSGNVACALLPGNQPVLGGGSLGVSIHSKKADMALAFIRWMSSEAVSSAATLLGSASACKRTYENYEIMDTYPWLHLVQNGFAAFPDADAQGAEACVDNRRLFSIIGKAVKSAVCGAVSAQEALRLAKEEYESKM